MGALPRAVLPLVEQLLGHGSVALPAPAGDLPEDGERVWMPKWSRGIYCTLPGSPPRPAHANGCHTDSHPLHIGAVGHIDDVLPESGALSVWDRNHRAFFPSFEYQYSQRRPEGQWNQELGSHEARGLRNDELLLKNEDLTLKNDDFLMKNDAFLLKNDAFLLKNDAFLLKNDGFTVQKRAGERAHRAVFFHRCTRPGRSRCVLARTNRP